MPRSKILLAGGAQAAAALQSALRKHGADAQVVRSQDLAAALVDMERLLQDERPQAAVAVGTGDDALALAIAASKLGVPLAACLDKAAAEDERRILVTLAVLETGPEPDRAADVIATWVSENRATAT